MDKQIIADIAEDAAELGRQLAAKGVGTAATQAEIDPGYPRHPVRDSDTPLG